MNDDSNISSDPAVSPISSDDQAILARWKQEKDADHTTVSLNDDSGSKNLSSRRRNKKKLHRSISPTASSTGSRSASRRGSARRRNSSGNSSGAASVEGTGDADDGGGSAGSSSGSAARSSKGAVTSGLPSRRPPTERRSRTELKEMREAVKLQQEKEQELLQKQGQQPQQQQQQQSTTNGGISSNGVDDAEENNPDGVQLLDFESLQIVGRDKEIKDILEIMQQTCGEQASSQVILILGGSGCGKTSLVRHTISKFQQQRKLNDASLSSDGTTPHAAPICVSGKFDANDTSVSRPYAAFLEVFSHLMHDLLEHPDATQFAERIKGALGAEDHKVTGLIPSIQKLFHTALPEEYNNKSGNSNSNNNNSDGDEDDASDYHIAAAKDTFQNRSSLKQIFRLIKEMMRQICSASSPVFVFLDDLQWGGKESLALFQDLANDDNLTNLLLIGTYRDEEIAPLSIMLEEIGDLKSNLIRLSDLEEEHVNTMVAHLINMDSKATTKFSSIVWRKTGGNALFVCQFLDRMQELGYLQYFSKMQRWGWDLPQIQRETNANDELQQILVYRIQFLPATAQTVLVRAASMGPKFRLDILTRILDWDHSVDLEADKAKDVSSSTGVSPIYMKSLQVVSEGTTASAEISTDVALIAKALEKLGFLRHLEDEGFVTYRFAHDKIHTAALTELNADHAELHWRTGQMLRRILEETEDDVGDQLFFATVEQLNKGSSCIANDMEERVELAALNLKASYKVKETSAFYPASGYAKEGLKMLAAVDHKWDFFQSLTTKLILVMAEMAMCCGQTKECMSATLQIIRHSRTLEEKVPAYRLRLQNLGQVNKFRQAVEEGLDVLNLLGEQFPSREPNMVTFAYQLALSKKDGFGRTNDDFCDLELMTDDIAKLKMKIMFEVVFYAVQGSDTTQKYVPLLFFRMFQLTMQYGICNESIVAFAGYGLLLAGSLNEYGEGHRFGQLAMDLQGGLGHRNLARGCILNHQFLHHLKEPLSESLHPLIEGFKAGMICDETADAVSALSVYFSHYLNCGLPLDPISGEIRQYLALMQELEMDRIWQITVPYAQLVANLMGKNTQPSVLSGDIMNLKQLMDRVKKAENINALRAIYAARMEVAYWFASYDMALRMIQHLKDLRLGVGQSLIFNHRREVFFAGMTYLALAKNSKNKRSYVWSARECIGKMKTWASRGSTDCEDLLVIMNAELYAVVGRKSNEEVAQAFEIAIENSSRVGSLQNIALATELAGGYYMSIGDHETGQQMLEAAYAGYKEWNAYKKASHLEILYPQMFTKLSVR